MFLDNHTYCCIRCHQPLLYSISRRTGSRLIRGAQQIYRFIGLRQRGAKRRGRGACTQISEFLMSASKIWMQSADWWILIIHDVILVFIFISGRDKKFLTGPTQTPLCGFAVAMRVILAFKFWL